MAEPPDVLARICAAKRAHVRERTAEEPLDRLRDRAKAASPPRGFRDRLAQALGRERYALIAEIKRASPSRGVIRADFDPVTLARAYARAGAACLSVLTDEAFFGGADSHLEAARRAVDLPVLRKDFVLDPYQVVEARALGADCILLILAALGDDEARRLDSLAAEHGMDALFEVHDRRELERALALGARLIGINNRDLKTLKVDLETTLRLAPLVPPGPLVVAESGLKSAADLAHLAAVGVRAFLVGEALMAEADVEAATRRLLGEPGGHEARP